MAAEGRKGAMTRKRKRLLVRLESIIGRLCYNANIQNYAAWGEWESAGRRFRYPLAFIGEDGGRRKTSAPDAAWPAKTLLSGHYAFGANQLLIIRA